MGVKDGSSVTSAVASTVGVSRSGVLVAGSVIAGVVISSVGIIVSVGGGSVFVGGGGSVSVRIGMGVSTGGGDGSGVVSCEITGRMLKKKKTTEDYSIVYHLR